jgi:hypothetical protein
MKLSSYQKLKRKISLLEQELDQRNHSYRESYSDYTRRHGFAVMHRTYENEKPRTIVYAGEGDSQYEAIINAILGFAEKYKKEKAEIE